MPVSTRPRVARPGSAPVADPARPRTWPRRLATVLLTVLTVLQLLAALVFLLVLTTVPQRVDLVVGPRAPTVGPQSAPAAVAPGPIGSPLIATVLDIPKLGLHQDLVELGLDPNGALQPPDSPDAVGWFAGAAAPGAVGPTVIAGHVDSRTGPGVFFRLKDLAPGDQVSVGRSDGGMVSYRVTGVQVVDKDQFPSQQVYGPTADAQLRLITCGGSFDRASGHYVRNVVVSGVQVDPT